MNGGLATTAAVIAAIGIVLGTLIALAAVPAAPSNQAVDLPEACLSSNPFFATACYVRGESFDDEPAVVAFRDTPDDTEHYGLATIGQVGSVWGMAYDPAKDVLYAGAYHKRNSKFGPLGPGGVYAIDVNGSGTVTPFITVPNAGPDRHDPSDNYQPDDAGRNYVGETSLGDIDMNEDGTELFAMNLRDKRIYRFSLPDGELIGSFASGGESEFWNRDARPFGLKVKDGWVFHGVVNSARNRQSLPSVWAYVYASRPNGTAMRRVAGVWLGYERGDLHPNWNPWPEDDDRGWRSSQYPHPMLTDIEFNDAGDMILGLRDRYLDTGPSLNEVYRRAPGDILIARKIGDFDWEVEDPSDGAFYDEGRLDVERATDWNRFTVGGLARVLTRDVVAVTAINPFRMYSDGAMWFDNADGAKIGDEELLYNALRHDGPQGKSQGLGDMEMICYIPPTPTPTNTASPTPIYTPTPTRTLTPTITPTPTPYEIYLPWGLKECPPKKRYIDVVLVLDRSTSMLRTIEGSDTPKNEAAIRAASRFVASLQLEPDYLDRHDQVAIVGFNDLAWIEHPLGNDREGALAALETLRGKTQEGTRLDLAFEQGQAALDGGSTMPENRQVMILLTDGLPNRVPFTPPLRQEDTVIAVAQGAKGKGTQVFTIGLGKPVDINPRMLIECSSNVYDYYYAPLPEDLDGIYERIAGRFFGCDEDELPPPTPCVPEFVHTDIMLVLDMSTSMQRTTGSGTVKLDAALDAARLFKDLLDFEPDGWHRRDQLGIVGFNDEAWTETLLTHDEAALDRAINALPEKVAEGTRLDLALQQGQDAIERSVRLPENRAILVLLTDGLPNRVPTPVPSGTQEDTVLAIAAAVKAKGTRVFTVGLGLPDDVLRTLLEEAASSPRDYYFAPDSEDLADIYRQIAGRIDECEPVMPE